VLILVGLFFLAHNFDLVDFDWDYIWPSILIIIGIGLLIRATRPKTDESFARYHQSRIFGDKMYEPTGEIDGTIYKHFIGDLELNLTRANFRPGENRIQTSIFIGDLKAFVPKNVALKTNLSIMLGDISVADSIESGFGPSKEYVSPNYDIAEKKLYIFGRAFIGDIKIRQI
jgi:predicted membrane protein